MVECVSLSCNRRAGDCHISQSALLNSFYEDCSASHRLAQVAFSFSLILPVLNKGFV